MYGEDAHLEMMFEDRFPEDPADWNERDFDRFDEDEDDREGRYCEGHRDDDLALTSGNSIGEPYYCDGTCA